MPSVSWEDINEILHDIKSDLVGLAKIEVTCQTIRKRVTGEIDKIQEIILRQADKG